MSSSPSDSPGPDAPRGAQAGASRRREEALSSGEEAEGLASPKERARQRRLAIVVEAFLRQIRRGGSLDPEPFLESAEELRDELAPLLRGVLRLEQASQGFDARRPGQSEGPADPNP